MKVVGFSFIRNAIKYDYPIAEAIGSILPLCDEFIVAVGKSDDQTLELVKSINPQKIKIIETVWDDSLRTGGAILAQQTNIALRAIPTDADWAFYIQGDEVIHEQYLPAIRKAMEEHKDNKNVDGLLFKYRHFYGSYDYVAVSPHWYRNEIRIVRPQANIYSYRDAQGFRKDDNKKLRVKPIDAYVFHYGWVRHPKFMQQKTEAFSRLYDNNQPDTKIASAAEFDYSGIDLLNRFTGTHPQIVKKRIEQCNWKFDHDISKNTMPWKYRFKLFIEKLTGWMPFEYKNYKIV